MSTFRLVLGIAFLALGLVSVLARDHIVARHQNPGRKHLQPPMLGLIMGGFYLLIGTIWVIAALV